MTKLRQRESRKPARRPEREWDAAAIADGILTWHMWPGFQGVRCDECGCEMNVMGMSYGHRCPDCDPDGERHEMHSMHDCGMMPFDEPRFGPSAATIRAGGRLADEISESKREYAVGTRVMLHDYWYGHGHRDYPVETGTIVEWDVEGSYPGMRYYRVDVDGGQEFKRVLESNIAPFRRFEDGAEVSVRHRDGWVRARVVGLENDEQSHFLYGQHWYRVELLAETDMSVNGAPAASSMVHQSVFNGRVREADIRPLVNPGCRWCQGTGEVTLATSTQPCLDCWPEDAR